MRCLQEGYTKETAEEAANILDEYRELQARQIILLRRKQTAKEIQQEVTSKVRGATLSNKTIEGGLSVRAFSQMHAKDGEEP